MGSDVLVVGGGVVGLAVAAYARLQGLSVVLLERDRVGQATSWGNCGLLTPSHADPLTQPSSLRRALTSLWDPTAPLRIAPTLSRRRIRWLYAFARHCTEAHRRRARVARAALLFGTRQLVEQLDDPDAFALGTQGLLTVFREPGNLAAATRSHEQMQQELGVTFDVWDEATLRREQPQLLAGCVGAIHARQDAHVDPGSLGQALARWARSLGVDIREGQAVHALRHEGARVLGVQTEADTLSANTTVLAAGSWSVALADTLGLHLPVEPGKGYSITWSQPMSGLQRPLYFYEPKVVATPWPHGFRLGSTMEFVGFEPALDPRRLALLREGASAFVDVSLPEEEGTPWAGFRPMTPDELPVLGPTSGLRGLMLATGHGMMGVSQSLASGKLVAELIAGATPHLDPTPYAPDRFTRR